MDNYTMVLGSNEIINCDAALVLETQEVFRVREDEMGRLLIDCDLRDKQGNRIAKIIKNTPVFVAGGFTYKVRPGQPAEVLTADGARLVSRIERLGRRKIGVNGHFNVEGGGCYVVAVPHGLFIPGSRSEISFNTIDGAGTAIRLTRHSMSIGG